MSVDFWAWFVVAVILVIIEVLAPAAYFLWMGIAAALVGVIVWLLPSLPMTGQVLLFSVLSIIALAVVKLYFRRHPIATDRQVLNRRGEQYVGRTFTLDEAVVNGVGKLRVDDTSWKIEGPDLVAGSKVKVSGVDGTVLRIEPL
jgi:membrane protein implicated in regulation of membrane protease activity